MCEALILFISLFIHWSIAPGNKKAVGLRQSRGEHFLLSWTTLSAGIQFVFGMRKLFHPQVQTSERYTNARTHAHTSISGTCYSYVIVHLNRQPGGKNKWKTNNNLIILLLTFTRPPFRGLLSISTSSHSDFVFGLSMLTFLSSATISLCCSDRVEMRQKVYTHSCSGGRLYLLLQAKCYCHACWHAHTDGVKALACRYLWDLRAEMEYNVHNCVFIGV